MRDGFLRVAAMTPDIRVADCEYNAASMIEAMRRAEEKGAKLLVLPELCMTGYTCGDLFLQDALIEAAFCGLIKIKEASKGMDLLVIFGMPFCNAGKLYNVAVAVQDGQILGIVPKTHLPNYSEFYEMRHFSMPEQTTRYVHMFGEFVPFGTDLLFVCREMPEFIVGIEICEDLWVPSPRSGALARAGAMIIANPSASDETAGKASYRRELVRGQSARTLTAYVYADAGEGESTTDLVFAGHDMIAENGLLLAEAEPFGDGSIFAEVDLGKLRSERRRITTYQTEMAGYEMRWFSLPSLAGYEIMPRSIGLGGWHPDFRREAEELLKSRSEYAGKKGSSETEELLKSRSEYAEKKGSLETRELLKSRSEYAGKKESLDEWKDKTGKIREIQEGELPEISLTRFVDPAPFVPKGESEQEKRWAEIIRIQAMGLKKRLLHTGCKHAVIGISGGLDSTLALLVACKAFALAGLAMEGILAVTMPCFGTTDRTYGNACALVKCLGATLREVDIKESVRLHLRDIGQSEKQHDVTYENAQARERTQVLMDLANQCNGLVVGTGDMSELALGWATYNGDHMSMYGVNASVPKTLVRYLVSYFAKETKDPMLEKVLRDILDTPVSPELLPPEDGKIKQKTEDIVGPYELHDFFLYYMMRFGFSPRKIFRLAAIAFEKTYEKEEIVKWLRVFYRRFFSQQFKRSCLPDGPKVGSVALSPRGDLRMPSDASMAIWQKELEELGGK